MSRLMTPVDPKHNIIQRKLDVIERSKTPNIKSNNNDNPTINYNLISVPDPTLFSRSDLLSWASNYPQVNKKKKSTILIYLSISIPWPWLFHCVCLRNSVVCIHQ